ncbi:ABC transporter permease [Hahella sp. CR1]|uniref:ABC transporter permease n=1 Tax=Hahella sp. CR1 TaxID=2992807 RepID=UPI0024428AF8|nr:FtsX-like permease family protein [Hahella sp. CR1]MDG9667011.1 ABC transporter permease [Hahella sp. CR1]
MRFLLELAWRDLRASGRSLWVFCACLLLGVTLVAASGGLYRMISAALLADTRMLLGGDLEVDSNAPLPPATLDWMRARGDISLVTELDTMLGGPDGSFLRVELQSTDANYPLYGELSLEPAADLAQVTAFANGHWGAAIDPSLANKLNLRVGDKVKVGSLTLEVRALTLNQPDRNLNANWRGAPVLLSQEALQASGLIQPGSRVDYEYRVRTSTPSLAWREQFYQAFPEQPWEVRTFEDRSRRISERLDQIASGLLIIGFSTLFIGGLGVFNSIQAYLQGKLKTIATLRALGLRNGRLAALYLLQTGIMAGGASLAGATLGGAMALLGAEAAATEIPIAASASVLAAPSLAAFAFGLLTAYAFALPAIGKALAASPAALFRGTDATTNSPSSLWRIATLLCAGAIIALVLTALPDPLFGVGFVAVVGLLLVLLDILVRLLRRGAMALDRHPALSGRFTLRLAVANLHRPNAPLRTSLLSLGSALTLLVASTLVVAALVRAIHATIPEESPALVLYDVFPYQYDEVVAAIQGPHEARLDMAPLVRSRILSINGSPLSERFSQDLERLRDTQQDEYKLSYSVDNIDNVTVVEGAWWADDAPLSEAGLPNLAMEDREARQLGLQLGDIIRFQIEGRELEAEVAAIFSQKGLQTRFWFEGILADGALEPFIHRYVGAAYMSDADALSAQNHVAQIAPNVITVRTAVLLTTARELLAKAGAGLAVVASVSLAASLLVLTSVMAAGRARQVYDATVLHSLGARMSVIKRGLHMEYALLALITSLFAVALGSAIALPLLHLRLKLPSEDLIWLGVVTAFSVSAITLNLGARYLMRRLQIKPASLLRDA